jgi:Rod binding domain-containing protein
VTNAVPTSGVAFMPALDRGALAARADNPQAAAARVPELMAACQSFEAVFFSQLMRVMRQGEMKDKLFGGTMAGGIYREMLDDQFADEMATSGSTGISTILYDSLEPLALLSQAQRAEASSSHGHGTDVVPDLVKDADARPGARADGQIRRTSP